MPSHPQSQDDATDRWLRLQRVIDDCITRRLAGEAITDAEVLAAHPELLPELSTELAHLALIERARRTAASRRPDGAVARWSAGDFPEYEMLADLQRCDATCTCHAIHDGTDREVVIRIFEAPVAATTQQRYAAVVEQAAGLATVGVMLPRAWGQAPSGRFFILSDFIVGESVTDRARAHLAAGTVQAAVTLLAECAELVQRLHDGGVVHGRLKAGNMLIDRAGSPHVLDMGVVELLESTNGRACTPPGRDVCDLGVLLQHSLSLDGSDEACGGPTPGAGLRTALAGHALPGLRMELQAIVERSVSGRQGYGSAAALAEDLRSWLAGRPVQACAARPGYVLVRTIGRGLRRLLQR